MGLSKEGQNKILANILSTPITSKEEMMKTVARLRAFGFEYGFNQSEFRYRAYEILLGITKLKTEEGTAFVNDNSKNWVPNQRAKAAKKGD